MCIKEAWDIFFITALSQKGGMVAMALRGSRWTSGFVTSSFDGADKNNAAGSERPRLPDSKV